jgi:hypothetical protein
MLRWFKQDVVGHDPKAVALHFREQPRDRRFDSIPWRNGMKREIRKKSGPG